jgi:hypothetical protein
MIVDFEPDDEALNRMKGILRTSITDAPDVTVGRLMAARAVLDLAVASFVLKPDTPLQVTRGEDDPVLILTVPGSSQSGEVTFDIDLNDRIEGDKPGNTIPIVIRPEDFDVSKPEGLARFRTYRALIDVIRRTPVPDDAEFARLGTIGVLPPHEKEVIWAAVWEVWEHANGE